jgi:hypothetical protein
MRFHTGKVGMKDSGNTTRSAPRATACSTSCSVFSIVTSRSRKAEAAWTAAARNLG